MARKRMISLHIVDSDRFISLSRDAQAYYFHLVLRADDEGFLQSPLMIGRMLGLSSPETLLYELEEKGYIISIDDVIVIRHWKMHNKIEPSKLNRTVSQRELAKLVEVNKIYDLAEKN